MQSKDKLNVLKESQLPFFPVSTAAVIRIVTQSSEKHCVTKALQVSQSRHATWLKNSHV